MIIVRLTGGLGNQMFQYAAARRLAVVNDSPLKLDLGWFDQIPSTATPRKFELKVFNIAGVAASREEVSRLRGVDTELWPKQLRTLVEKSGILRKRTCIREKNYHFDAAILVLRGDAYLDGCWQSEKYFEDVAETVRKEFTFGVEPSPANARMSEVISGCNAVGIHVRRGDYISNETTRQYHGVAPLEYYRRAIDSLVDRVGNPHFFVFSDDPEWVKRNLASRQPTTFVDHNGPDSGFEDLRLMSLCQHQIIANSSFSWWAAWLNRNPGKIVFAPQTWFGAAGPDTKDLIPDDWYRI